MKRILLSLVLVLGWMVSPTPSVYAATEGCPSGWAIDTSKSGDGIQQLQKVKLRLGSDMALIEGELQFTDFAGESGPITPPKDRRLTLSDLYLYGNTKVSRSYVVQVKNCPDSTTFTMNFGSFKEWAVVNLILDGVNSTEWAPANEALFQDFLVAGKFSDCLAKKKMKLQKPGYIQTQISGKTLLILNIDDFWSGYGSSNQKCGLNLAALFLVDKTPNCRYMNSPSNVGPIRTGIAITIGSKCSFAFAVKDTFRTLTIFETFTIDSKNWITSITCIKGKTKKVIQGVPNPEFKLKCPAGYKVKK